jgi:hypothetical protein
MADLKYHLLNLLSFHATNTATFFLLLMPWKIQQLKPSSDVQFATMPKVQLIPLNCCDKVDAALETHKGFPARWATSTCSRTVSSMNGMLNRIDQ